MSQVPGTSGVSKELQERERVDGQGKNSEEIELRNSSFEASATSASRKRWHLLAKAIFRGKTRRWLDANEDSQDDVISVRKFTSFNLICYSAADDSGNKAEKSSSNWAFLEFPYARIQTDLKILVKLPSGVVSLDDIRGFNNTGNVCVWPAEEVMGHFCLRNSEKFRGKVVLELGAGMTGIAGLAVAFCGQPKKVIITDGNDSCCSSLQEIIGKNSERLPALNLLAKIDIQRLRWAEKSEYASFLGKIDWILSADCLFFDESREGLLETISDLLTPTGQTLLFAPSRSGTYEKFMEMARKSGLFQSVESLFDYDGMVTEMHRNLLNVDIDSRDYDPNLHYPMLLWLKK